MDIVIPAHECVDLTMRCLDAIAADSDGLDLRIIYVDNGSSGKTVDKVEEHARTLGLKIQTIRNWENYGFTYAVNQGLKAAKSDVLVLNNDSFVASGCLQGLQKTLDENNLAAVGPLSNYPGLHDAYNPAIRRGRMVLDRSKLSSSDPKKIAAVLRKLNRGYMQTKVVSFFCTLISKAAIDSVGLLSDATELASGLLAEDEWCLRASRLGLRVGIDQSVYCEHLCHKTFDYLGIDRNKRKKDAAIFMWRKYRYRCEIKMPGAGKT